MGVGRGEGARGPGPHFKVRGHIVCLTPHFLIPKQLMYTVFPLIEAGSQIQAGGQTSFVLIEAGSLI